MTPLQAAANGAILAAAVTGVLLALRRRDHRPAAAALVLLVVLVLVRFPLIAVLRPLPLPIEGSGRVFVYLDGAAKLAILAVTPGLAFAVCSARPRRAVGAIALAWLLASIVLAALYPSPLVRGEGLRRVYLGANLAGVAAAALAFAAWRRVPRSPSPAHVVALLLAAIDLVTLLNPLGPWRAGLFGVSLDPARLTILVGFIAIALYQGITWNFSSPSS